MSGIAGIDFLFLLFLTTINIRVFRRLCWQKMTAFSPQINVLVFRESMIVANDYFSSQLTYVCFGIYEGSR